MQAYAVAAVERQHDMSVEPRRIDGVVAALAVDIQDVDAAVVALGDVLGEDLGGVGGGDVERQGGAADLVGGGRERLARGGDVTADHVCTVAGEDRRDLRRAVAPRGEQVRVLIMWKLVLPMLGGSPSVWNTSMVFFQAALLVGYAYAHALQRIGSLKAQAGVHLALLLVAALFLPPTLIASIYGMNFQAMPELEWAFGYPMALVLMVLVGVALYVVFKVKDWL